MNLFDSLKDLKESLGPELSQVIDAYITVFVVLLSVVSVVVIAAVALTVIKSLKSKKLKKSYEMLKTGMSKDDVVAMLGAPSNVGAEEGDIEILTWSVFSGRRTKTVTVKIKDGKVIMYVGSNLN